MEQATSVSLCVIVRNEAALIGDFLEHVRGQTDEVIVTDTGSSDDTTAIATRLGATVLQQPWNDDYAAARNVAIDAARSSWILVLDADERLDAGAIAALKERCAAQPEQVLGLLFDVRNYIDESPNLAWQPLPTDERERRGHRGYLPSQVVRLFRNDSRVRYSGRVHELVEPSITDAGGKIVAADCTIHHTLREHLDVNGRTKGEVYLDLLEQKAHEQPECAKSHWEFGLQALGQGFVARGVAALEQAWRLQPGNLEIGAALALGLNDLGRGTDALRVLRHLHTAEPNDPRIKYELGRALYIAGDVEHARQAFGDAHVAAPHLQQPLYWLARTSAATDVAAAQSALDQRKLLVDDAPGRLLEAELLLRRGDLEAGSRACEAAALALTADTTGDGWDQLLGYLDECHAELLQAVLATVATTPTTGTALAGWLESRGCDRVASQLYAALGDYNAEETATGTSPAAPEQRLQWRLRRAVALRRCGDDARAQRLLEELCATEDSDATRAVIVEAHYALAQSHLGAAEWNEGAAQLARVIAYDPRHTRALTDLAGLHGNSGRPELAMELLQAAVVHAPKNALIHHNLGVAALLVTPPDAGVAQRHLNEAALLGHAPDPAVQARLAQLLQPAS